jgi:hypothetical protein
MCNRQANEIWLIRFLSGSVAQKGKRRAMLEAYLRDVVRRSFPNLPYDEAAATWHGEERASKRSASRHRSSMAISRRSPMYMDWCSSPRTKHISRASDGRELVEVESSRKHKPAKSSLNSSSQVPRADDILSALPNA